MSIQEYKAKRAARWAHKMIADPLITAARLRGTKTTAGRAKLATLRAAMETWRTNGKAKAHSASSLRGKSLYPWPVIDALTESGERLRLSFWSPADRMDFDRGRRLVAALAKSPIVDATFWHNGCQVEEFAPVKPRAPSLAKRIAAILDAPDALAQIRAMVA